MSFNVNMLAIPFACFLLASLVMWYVIGCGGKWFTKVVFMLLIFVMGFGVWKALPSYAGWPTSDSPPKGVIMGVSFDEPAPKSGNPGRIYLMLGPAPQDEDQEKLLAHPWWFVPVEKAKDAYSMLTYHADPNEPRLYGIPYSRQLHEDIEKGLQQSAKSGRPLVYDPHPKKGNGVRGGTGRQGGSGYSGSDDDSPQIYELPPSHAPSKDVH